MIERTTGYSEGGLASHVKELATFLSAHGHSVEIMTCKGSCLHELRGINVYYLPRINGRTQNKLVKLACGLFYTALAFFAVIRLLGKKRYDLVVVFFYWEAFLMRFIYALTGLPYSYIMAGDTDLELIEGKRASLPIQISNYMAKECREEYSYSPVVIPKGIDLSRFNIESRLDGLRKKFHLGNDRIILSVAMLSDRKDLITLVRAARIVLSRSGRETFLIVGDGPERQKIREEIRVQGVERKVRLLGSLRYQDTLLPALYGESDIFVLPTLYEGFGWVFLEAMASGLPILSTNVGSNPEVIGDVAVLVPPKRPPILADEILWLLNDKKKLFEMRQKGLQKVKKYDWNALLPEYENAFYYEISRTPLPLFKRLFTFTSNLKKDLPLLVNFYWKYYQKRRWQ
jgi:glycosyltransferase involved in cell wall biosynthesis